MAERNSIDSEFTLNPKPGGGFGLGTGSKFGSRADGQCLVPSLTWSSGLGFGVAVPSSVLSLGSGFGSGLGSGRRVQSGVQVRCSIQVSGGRAELGLEFGFRVRFRVLMGWWGT